MAFGVEKQTFLHSVCGKFNLYEFASNAKSGQVSECFVFGLVWLGLVGRVWIVVLFLLFHLRLSMYSLDSHTLRFLP